MVSIFSRQNNVCFIEGCKCEAMNLFVKLSFFIFLCLILNDFTHLLSPLFLFLALIQYLLHVTEFEFPSFIQSIRANWVLSVIKEFSLNRGCHTWCKSVRCISSQWRKLINVEFKKRAKVCSRKLIRFIHIDLAVASSVMNMQGPLLWCPLNFGMHRCTSENTCYSRFQYLYFSKNKFI